MRGKHMVKGYLSRLQYDILIGGSLDHFIIYLLVPAQHVSFVKSFPVFNLAPSVGTGRKLQTAVFAVAWSQRYPGCQDVSWLEPPIR